MSKTARREFRERMKREEDERNRKKAEEQERERRFKERKQMEFEELKAKKEKERLEKLKREEERKKIDAAARRVHGCNSDLGDLAAYESQFYSWKNSIDIDSRYGFERKFHHCPICGVLAEEEKTWKYYPDGDSEPMYAYAFKRNSGACAQCVELYKKDLAEGRFPMGLHDSAHRYFNFSAWYDLKSLEKMVELGKMDKVTAAEKKEFIIWKLNRT